MPRLYAHPIDPPAADAYAVRRALHAGTALQRASDEGWAHAEAIAWGPEPYRTTFRALWDDDALYVRFECVDRAPWWTIVERDGCLWEEEVVEIFLDPARSGFDYVEVEISPANVVCDLRVSTPWPNLRADAAWDLAGLRSCVYMTSPTPAGDVTWVAVAILPFAGLAPSGPTVAFRVPPVCGDRWRFNVFRIKRPGGPSEPEADAVYAAWSVPDGPSFHVPDVFRDLVFAG